ncbi:MAG: GIY-YIG nuclease family protein [Fibrobacter sp.]|jgi:Predicted endonuclease containing a URI domain|nr:GIY-YIG nuclease family protein [Fibrobacter sp.]
MSSYMYILKCSDGSYYTGSTRDLEKRVMEHNMGMGANYTRKHLPVELVYFEEFQRVDDAYAREKQVQGWTRSKKEALIKGQFGKLTDLSKSTLAKHSAVGKN